MNITSQFGEKTEISCIIFLINWIWLANKKQRTAPEGSSRGRPGVEGRPSDPDSLNSVFLAKHKWLKFILNQCQVPSAALSLRAQVSESTETEREDISCIISCSAKRCLSDLVHDTPPCFSVSSSLALFYGVLSLCVSVCLLSLSVFLSFPPGLTTFPPSSSQVPAAYSWQPRGHIAGWVRYARYPLPSGRHSRCRLSLYTHFLTTRSRGSVFCCSWTARSKSFSFALSVCAARLTKTQDPFFPARSASSGMAAGPPAPTPVTHTHHTPTTSLEHQIFHVRSGGGGEEARDGKKRRYSVFMKTNWSAALTSAV